MFLNDAVDQEFDRRHRPERPIISGRIASRTVWVLSFVWLLAGWATFLSLGNLPALLAALLLSLIVLYDVVHKRNKLAPLLMAGCRFLLYPIAATAATGTSSSSVLWRAAALGAYIVGLSYLARGESTGARLTRWTAALLFVPALIAVWDFNRPGWLSWTGVIIQIAWTLWCLWPHKPKPHFPLPHSVAGLLAGIALVDLIAAIRCGLPWAFVALFLLALLLQRVSPAT
jgi:4-hydroxybenzoate polyprenyltransferase